MQVTLLIKQARKSTPIFSGGGGVAGDKNHMGEHIR